MGSTRGYPRGPRTGRGAACVRALVQVLVAAAAGLALGAAQCLVTDVWNDADTSTVATLAHQLGRPLLLPVWTSAVVALLAGRLTRRIGLAAGLGAVALLCVFLGFDAVYATVPHGITGGGSSLLRWYVLVPILATGAAAGLLGALTRRRGTTGVVASAAVVAALLWTATSTSGTTELVLAALTVGGGAALVARALGGRPRVVPA